MLLLLLQWILDRHTIFENNQNEPKVSACGAFMAKREVSSKHISSVERQLTVLPVARTHTQRHFLHSLLIRAQRLIQTHTRTSFAHCEWCFVSLESEVRMPNSHSCTLAGVAHGARATRTVQHHKYLCVRMAIMNATIPNYVILVGPSK